MIGKGEGSNEIKFLNNYTNLTNRIIDGDVPDSIKILLSTTQGSPIPKKNGSIRPLGLRDGFANVTLKIALKVKSTNRRK